MSSNKRAGICRNWFSDELIFDGGGDGSFTITTGELKFPKTDSERLQDAEKDEQELLSEMPPATAPENERRL